MRKHTIIALLSGIYITGSALGSSEKTNETLSAKEKIVYIHKATGFRFPEQFDGYKYLEITDFNDDGTDIGVGYSSEDGEGQLTLYVYPAPKGTVGPIIRLDEKGARSLSPNPRGVYLLSEASDSYSEHYQAVVGGILSSHQGWDVESMDTRRQAIPEQNGPVSYKTIFAGIMNGRMVQSEFLLFVSHDHFVKMRLTYPAGEGLLYSRVNEFPLSDVKDDQRATIEALRSASEEGDLPSMHMLGLAYIEGRGIHADPAEGIPWCRKAAEGGYAPAMRTLASMYISGTGVEVNPRKAANWYRKAAEQGDAEAQYKLASMYLDGEGVDKNPKDAVKWCRMAAEQGVVEAAFMLGMLCAHGKGIEQNFEEAEIWFRRVAEMGDVPAMFELGKLLLVTQIGNEESVKEGVSLIRKAADSQYPVAMTFLGSMYVEAFGVLYSETEARKWLKAAAELGDAEAMAMLDSLEKD